ncbi:MAG: CAP domain-containing protein [Corynebacterium sp.]|uniref:CAP domain-containing protein n=1 Tax=Corynebacterium sp. TaxID=1720 RepID=UPI0026E07626|nr:CAP domain-containing protein [Corynebacterium sp.]MDO5669011.1 CAP domain-containing protein [Corynebacterium sp.]
MSSTPWHSPEGLKTLLLNTGTLITVVGLIMTLLMAVLPGGGDIVDDIDTVDTGYVQPDPDTQAALDKIREDVGLALLQLRAEEGVAPVAMTPGLQFAAQRQAERNAVAGEELPSPHNVTMLQYSMPLDTASGHAVVDAWLHSEAHAAQMLHPRYTLYATAVTFGHGKVWVALQLAEV